MSRDHYWKEFYRLKVHVCFVERLLGEAERTDRGIKIFTAITSSTSIGAWVIWKDLAIVWGSLIALSQVLNAVRPYLPYKDRLRSYAGLRLELEEILLGAEAQWLEIADNACSATEVRKALADLRARRHKAFKKHLGDGTIPSNAGLFAEAEAAASDYFDSFYSEEGQDDDPGNPPGGQIPAGAAG